MKPVKRLREWFRRLIDEPNDTSLDSLMETRRAAEKPLKLTAAVPDLHPAGN